MSTSNNNNDKTCVGEPPSLHNLSLSSNGSDTYEEKELSPAVVCDDSGMQSLEESSDSTRESVSEKTEQDELEDDVFLKALYDYEYSYDNGDKVTMIKGDVYRLLSNNADDWWQVEKVTDGNVIYVPADYVFKIEDYYPGNNRPLPPIIAKEAPDNITNPVETKPVEIQSAEPQLLETNLFETIPVEIKPAEPQQKPHATGEKRKKHPAPIATPEMVAAAKAKAQSKPNTILNRSFSSDNAGTVPMTISSSFGWPDSSETTSQTNFSINNNNNNNSFDACIQVVVNSDNQYPQEILRSGNYSTFGKGSINPSRTLERPKSYHYGASSRYLESSEHGHEKTIHLGKCQNSQSSSDYINLDELGPVLRYQKEPENGSVESLTSSKDRKVSRINILF